MIPCSTGKTKVPDNLNNLFFITYSISQNGTPYERLRYLSTHYNVYVFCHKPIHSELVPLCKAVYTCPGRFFRLDLLLFPFWVAIKALSGTKKPIIFTSYNNTPLITGYLLKLFGLRWIADIFDDPLKYVDSIKRDPFSIRKLFSLIYFYVTYFIIRFGMKKADLVICSMVEHVLEEYGIPKSKLFPVTNGVDLTKTDKIRNGINGVRKPDDLFKIVYIGEMSSSRPMDLVFDAVNMLSEKIENFMVLLIGNASHSFQETVKQSAVADKVSFLGYMDQEDAYKTICECHIGLCLLRNVSDYPYSYPLKIFEYLALGCVVVATELPGIKKIIQDGVNGILIPPDDSESLRRTLLELYKNPELRQYLCDKGREYVREFNWENINHKILLRMKKAINE